MRDRLRRWFRLPVFDERRAREEMDEEIRFHLEERAALFRERGYTPEEAAAEARRRFGRVEHATRRLQLSAARKESSMRMKDRLETLRHDVQYALRSMRRAPGFAAAVVMTLALGIGANTAIFSVVRGVLLSDLPYADSDRVVMVWNHWTDWPETWLSQPEVHDYTQERELFAGLSAFTTGEMNLTGAGEPERLNVGFMEASLLDVVGVKPVLGRNFVVAEDQPNGPTAALLLQDFWERRYGADRSLLGGTIHLNGTSYTVVGILPSSFRLPLEFAGEHAQVLLPLRLGPPDENERGSHGYNAVARLAPGLTLAQAERRLDALTARLRAEHDNYDDSFGANLVPVDRQVRGSVQSVLWLLLGAVSFVLLIACVNVANLLVARAESRGREVAVRAALGAGRTRLAFQFLTESMVLALIGGAFGLLLAVAIVRVLPVLQPAHLPRIDIISIDGLVLGYTLGISLLIGLFFGLAPALHLAGGRAEDLLRQGRGNTSGRGRVRIRHVLVAVELALAVMALTGAALMTRSFTRLLSVPPGFVADHVLTLRLAPPSGQYPTSSSVRTFYAQLLEQIRALPGVTHAGAITALPLTTTIGDWSFYIEGDPEPDAEHPQPAADWQAVTSGFFDAMRMPIIRGRDITDADRLGAELVVVLSETTAKRFFPNRDAIGRRLRLGGTADSLPRTVVGIVGDVRFNGLDHEPRATMYIPHAQFIATVPDEAGVVPRSLSLTIRTANEPLALVTAVRAAVRRMDADVPLAQIRTLDDIVTRSVSTPRLATYLLLAFGVLALSLSAIGVYAVMSYVVAQRTSEIGIRMALGARAPDIIRLVMGQGMRPVLFGVAVGSLAALAVTRVMRGLLHSVSATDPVSFAAAIVILMAVAVLANWRPAWRAAAIDPLDAARAE